MNTENKINSFIEFLTQRLKMPMPGLDAHKKMAPITGKDFFRTFKPSESANQSAVLLLLINNKNGIQILFTLRSKNISHSGQISFPGGRSENAETPEMTALRETREEIGIQTEKISILGEMSPLFVPPSDNIIIPVVGYSDISHEFIPNYDEVQEVFLVPLEKFHQEEFKKIQTWNFNNIDVDVPFWDVHPTVPLWGATAMILTEFLALYEEFKKLK